MKRLEAIGPNRDGEERDAFAPYFSRPPLTPLPMTNPDFIQHTTANGIEIIVESLPTAYSAAFGMFVKTGSRDETPEQSGLSHYLEHMVFKGTPRRTALQVNQELDELGGQSNAYTSEEQTVYYGTVLPKYQHRMVDVLIDLLRPNLRDEDFATEKQVILEEIAKYDDSPPFGAFERAMLRYFPDDALGRPILGTTETIAPMSCAAMQQYFVEHYRPDNLVVAAAGNVDVPALVDQIEQLTGDWKPNSNANGRTAAMPATRPQVEILPSPDATLAYSVLMWPSVSLVDPHRYAFRLLATILGDESGSRLFWELIDTGRAEAAALWPQEFQDCGVMMGYLASLPELLEDNLRLFQGVLSRAADAGITEEELQQARNKTAAALILQSEQPSNRMFTLASRWIARHRYQSLDQTLDHYRAVTRTEINELLTHLSQPRVQVQVR